MYVYLNKTFYLLTNFVQIKHTLIFFRLLHNVIHIYLILNLIFKITKHVSNVINQKYLNIESIIESEKTFSLLFMKHFYMLMTNPFFQTLLQFTLKMISSESNDNNVKESQTRP